MTKAISRGNSKEAALYFDQVLPDDFFASLKAGSDDEIKNLIIPIVEDYEESKALFEKLVGSQCRNDDFDYLTSLNRARTAAFSKYLIDVEGARDPAFTDRVMKGLQKAQQLCELDGIEFKGDYSTSELIEFRRKSFLLQQKLFERLGYEAAPVWTHPKVFPSLSSDSFGENASSVFEFSLRDLQLVDATKLSWRQIMEFREDEDNARRLRGLRLFFHENLKGKDKSFITDKMMSLQEEHVAAAHFWGMETKRKSFSAIFDQKTSLIPSGIAALLSLAGTIPPAISIGLITSISFGHILLEVARRNIEYNEAKLNDQGVYLTRLKKLGESGKGGPFDVAPSNTSHS